jgi:CBS domain-containing membrane protein
MTETVFTLAWHDSLETAAELMDVKHIRHVPVVDRDGDLVGLVTQRDLARSVLGPTEDLPISVRQEVLSRRKVREIMATEIDTAEPDTDLREAAEMLIENKIGCLPIVEGAHLVGILTEADFVRRFLEKG